MMSVERKDDPPRNDFKAVTLIGLPNDWIVVARLVAEARAR